MASRDKLEFLNREREMLPTQVRPAIRSQCPTKHRIMVQRPTAQLMRAIKAALLSLAARREATPSIAFSSPSPASRCRHLMAPIARGYNSKVPPSNEAPYSQGPCNQGPCSRETCIEALYRKGGGSREMCSKEGCREALYPREGYSRGLYNKGVYSRGACSRGLYREALYPRVGCSRELCEGRCLRLRQVHFRCKIRAERIKEPVLHPPTPPPRTCQV
mmetsp:Transcript_28076/g.91046  ORF Transcript_28076/g.91046 Transcript_28076/m.91046 type:complete len:218 (+) Transcript_28076:255-908(+)